MAIKRKEASTSGSTTRMSNSAGTFSGVIAAGDTDYLDVKFVSQEQFERFRTLKVRPIVPSRFFAMIL